MHFDGINDFISVPNASNVIANKNLSLSFWVYPTNPAPNFPNFDGMAGFRNNANADFYILHLSSTTVEARFRNSSGTNYDIVFSGLVQSTWNHFVMTYDGSTLTLYHNGISVGTQSASGNITTTTETLYIGNLLFQTTNFNLNGQMDDVALWSKSLTANEVTTLYNGCSMDLTASGLELAYEFNQGAGGGNNTSITSLIDSKGNINGVLNNFSLTGATSNFVLYSQNAQSLINASVCNTTYTSPTGNHIWSTSGVYYDTLVGGSFNGCDSIITVNLVVGNTTNNTVINVSDCNSYTSQSGNYTWTTTGNYVDTIQSVAGCDSILNINLTITSSSSNISVTACGSYTAPSGTQTFNSSATFDDVIPNYLNCDSTITINLTINPNPDTTVTQSLNTLTAAATGANYQWLNCGTNYVIVFGATSQTFSPVINGSYAVEVELNGCKDTSFCHNVYRVSTTEAFETPINIFPNPTTGSFLIDLGQAYSEVSIQITDAMGKVIRQVKYQHLDQIDLNLDEPAGVYFVIIQSEERRSVTKLLVTE